MTFRGMVKDGEPGAGGWVFGYVQAVYKDSFHLWGLIEGGTDLDTYEYYSVIPDSVSQVTPFTDRAGQDLYQDDVIDFLTMPGQAGFSRGRVIIHNGQLMAEERSGRKISISVLCGQFRIRGPYYQEPGLMDLPAIDFLEDQEMEYQILLQKLRSFRKDMIQLMADHKVKIFQTHRRVRMDVTVYEHFFQLDGQPWTVTEIADLLTEWSISQALTVEDFRPGDMVTYKGTAHSQHSGRSIPFEETGIVKVVGPEKVFVVFNFDESPERYAEFTAEGCDPGDLVEGWPNQAITNIKEFLNL